MEKQARVGIAAFIFKEGKFLFLQRNGAHGAGEWTVPGGHLEFSESFSDTVIREVKEETDLEVENIRFGAITNDFFEKDNKHYVTVWMICDYKTGEEKIMEPSKCTGMKWVDFDTLPNPLFSPCWPNLLKSEFIDDLRKII